MSAGQEQSSPPYRQLLSGEERRPRPGPVGVAEMNRFLDAMLRDRARARILELVREREAGPFEVGLAILGSVMASRFTASLQASLPAGLPPQLASRLTGGANALADPGARDQMQAALSQLGPQGQAMFEQLLGAMRQSLAVAVHDVFLAGVAAMALAWLTVLFLKEIPLRARHGTGAVPVRDPGLAGGGGD